MPISKSRSKAYFISIFLLMAVVSTYQACSDNFNKPYYTSSSDDPTSEPPTENPDPDTPPNTTPPPTSGNPPSTTPPNTTPPPVDAPPFTREVSDANIEKLRPFVLLNSQALNLSAPTSAEGVYVWQVKDNTTEIGSLTLSEVRPSILRLKFSPSTSGVYTFGLKINAEKVRKISPNLPWLRDEEVVLRYPYDWTKRYTPGAIEPNMIMPGVLADGLVVAHASDQLFEINVKMTAGSWNITFSKQLEITSNGDRTTKALSFNANGEQSLYLVVSPSVRAAQRKNYEAKSLKIEGQMTQIAYRDWGSDTAGLYISPTEFERVATKYKQNGIKHVILRMNEPKAEFANLLKKHNITPHFYHFLGVARKRTALNGVLCYSLMVKGQLKCMTQNLARDSNGRIFTPKNDNWAFLNMRRPEVRRILVNQIKEAVENGYQGIFFDGPQLWAANDGRIGGEDNESRISWYRARSQLLKEIREMLAQVAPNTVLGTLGNTYIDYQAQADYTVKEIADWSVLPYAPNPRQRVLNYDLSLVDLVKDSFYAYAPRFYLGFKGNNPTAIRNLHLRAAAEKVAGEPYVEVGDFEMRFLQTYADVMANVAKNLD